MPRNEAASGTFPTFGRAWTHLTSKSGRIQVAHFVIGGLASYGVLALAYWLIGPFAGREFSHDTLPASFWVSFFAPIAALLAGSIAMIWFKRTRLIGIGALCGLVVPFALSPWF